MTRLNRRDFTKKAALSAAGTALAGRRARGANDRIRLGLIGVGNRGDQLLDAFLPHKDAEVVAVCDLSAAYRDFAAHKAGTQPATCQDYRQVLDRKDVDAVVIATPDHWHALQTIQGCQAGKDVYVEKPLSLCVEEGRKMVEAARRYRRVTQVGIMRRSSPHCREAAEFIRKGGIGKVTVARAFHIQNEWPKGIGSPANEAPPADFDWESWLGPAPKVPYNKNRTFYRFRWFYDYSGGQVTNFGVHYLDMIHWALGHDTPLAVTALGGKFVIPDNREVPDTLEALWLYPGNTLVTFSQYNASAAPAARTGEIEFRGTKGTLYVYSSGYEVVPEILKPNEFPARSPVNRPLERRYRQGAKAEITPVKKGGGKDPTVLHARNFLDCIRSRQACHCDIEVGHRDTTAALIANIALKTKSQLEWDAQAERFTNSAAANKHLRYEYRKPYQFPA